MPQQNLCEGPERSHSTMQCPIKRQRMKQRTTSSNHHAMERKSNYLYMYSHCKSKNVISSLTIRSSLSSLEHLILMAANAQLSSQYPKVNLFNMSFRQRRSLQIVKHKTKLKLSSDIRAGTRNI